MLIRWKAHTFILHSITGEDSRSTTLTSLYPHGNRSIGSTEREGRKVKIRCFPSPQSCQGLHPPPSTWLQMTGLPSYHKLYLSVMPSKGGRLYQRKIFFQKHTIKSWHSRGSLFMTHATSRLEFKAEGQVLHRQSSRQQVKHAKLWCDDPTPG